VTPEGDKVSARHVVSTQGLDEPAIIDVARSITRHLDNSKPLPGTNGYYEPGRGVLAIDKNLTGDQRYRVLAHETGHALDHKSGKGGPWDGMAISSSIGKELRGAGLFHPTRDEVHELHLLSKRARPVLWSDDATLARHYPGHDPKALRSYRQSYEELLADAISVYMREPLAAKAIAPNATARIRKFVNSSKIKDIISFASISGVALSSLLATALQSSKDDDNT
jgi:hypothetical protein